MNFDLPPVLAVVPVGVYYAGVGVTGLVSWLLGKKWLETESSEEIEQIHADAQTELSLGKTAATVGLATLVATMLYKAANRRKS